MEKSARSGDQGVRMQESKLGLDEGMVSRAREAAASIAGTMDQALRQRSTVAVERTTLRMIGVQGVDDEDVPLVNGVVDAAREAGLLQDGIMRLVCQGVLESGREPTVWARAVVEKEFDLGEPGGASESEIRRVGDELIDEGLAVVEANRSRRDDYIAQETSPERPLHYVIVATGNIYEDALQAKTAARQGADIIAVIRSTGQSLLDFVPYGATTEGYGGTYATQENFRIVREALDEVGQEEGRYIRLCNYCSGLCMPEIAAMGALERLDVMLNDALYGILFRDINPRRTFIDQYFSRMINAYAGVVINTGEDNYLTTADAVEAAHTVTASQFLNEQLAALCGLEPWQMGLGHAMEIDPDLEDGFLMELAQAQLARELFPEAPLKFMPPTKYMTGNIFKGHIQDALFNLVGMWTHQGIQLLGMMTEAMHTPHMGDRYLALENAQYVMNNARSLGEEITFKPGGKIQRRAQSVLQEAGQFLEDIDREGIFEALAQGRFADVKRPRDGGKGGEGVFERGSDYYNPLEDKLRDALKLS